MARVLGIDPGTGSMDLLLLDDSKNVVLFEEAIPRKEVTKNPRIIINKIEMLNEEYSIDGIAAPSGYGLPPTPPRDLLLDYILEATFINERDLMENLQIHGLRKVMLELANYRIPVFFTPGAIMLKSVPYYRKINKIDLGTADKVFSVAAALRAEVEDYRENISHTSFIVIESGLAYNAALAVERGKIVDGVGGTLGSAGFLGLGGMDAELAYALSSIEPGFSRKRLFEGGIAYMCGVKSLPELENLLKRKIKCANDAINALSEGIVKNIFQLLPSLENAPRRIYVSGRIFRTRLRREILLKLESTLEKYGLSPEIVEIPRLGNKTKEGATGAAILASGYIGSRYKWIVDTLGLMEASGSIFDYILLEGVRDKAKEYFRRVGRDML